MTAPIPKGATVMQSRHDVINPILEVIFCRYDPALGDATAKVLEQIMAEVRSTKAIAAKLNLSEIGVRYHLQKLRTCGLFEGDIRTGRPLPHPNPMPRCTGEHTCYQWVSDRQNLSRKAIVEPCKSPRKAIVKLSPIVGSGDPPCHAFAEALMLAGVGFQVWDMVQPRVHTHAPGGVNTKHQTTNTKGDLVGCSISISDFETAGFRQAVFDDGESILLKTAEPLHEPPLHHAPDPCHAQAIPRKKLKALSRWTTIYDYGCDPDTGEVVSRMRGLGLTEGHVMAILLSLTRETIQKALSTLEADLRRGKVRNAAQPDSYFMGIISRHKPEHDLFRQADLLLRSQAHWGVNDGELVVATEPQSTAVQQGARSEGDQGQGGEAGGETAAGGGSLPPAVPETQWDMDRPGHIPSGQERVQAGSASHGSPDRGFAVG